MSDPVLPIWKEQRSQTSLPLHQFYVMAFFTKSLPGPQCYICPLGTCRHSQLGHSSSTAGSGVKVKLRSQTHSSQSDHESSCRHSVGSYSCSGRCTQTGTHVSPGGKALLIPQGGGQGPAVEEWDGKIQKDRHIGNTQMSENYIQEYFSTLLMGLIIVFQKVSKMFQNVSNENNF